MGNYTRLYQIQDDVLDGAAVLAAKGRYYVYRTSYAQVHECSGSQNGDNREGALGFLIKLIVPVTTLCTC